MAIENLGEMILAIGAVGTAAFGLVDVAKRNFSWVGTAGFQDIEAGLGDAVFSSLKAAYGSGSVAMLKQQYVGDDHELFKHTIRQGVRLGLSKELAPDVVRDLGLPTSLGETLKGIADKVQAGTALEESEKLVLARFELAVDARIDGALARASVTYKGKMQLYAMLVSFAVSLAVAYVLQLGKTPEESVSMMLEAIIVGLIAVPLAPIAKDLANTVTAIGKALERKVS